MKTWTYFLMYLIGLGLFFFMMLKGWGLEIENIFPVILYYCWTFISTMACVYMRLKN